ncbi:MAG TPA: SIMPL domain-containing protein [Chitinophagaceae bacterium]|nr:SIMPL domain-containing protein [Chitinophagaceae bacterium]
MKKLIVATFLLSASVAGLAQNNDRNPFPKTITATGVAEMELVPDEIYVNIDLKEYDKKGNGKVGLEKIKTDFLKSVRSIGLPDSVVSIAGYDGFNGNPYWLRKKKKEELYASITYQVKFNNSKKMDELVEKLDDMATQNFYITRTTHSKLETYRKTLKMQAVKAAKEKATYLTEAIDEKVGEAVTINEPQEYYQPYINARAANYSLSKQNLEVADAGSEAPVMDFKKIKLRYDVTATFAIK